MHLTKIPITDLRESPLMDRAVIDTEGIDELAGSIRKVGVLNPLHVREKDGYFEIEAGRRRYRASKVAGLSVVPCLVLGPKDAPDLAVKVHENLYRQDLSPVEEAAFYAELLPTCGDDTDRLAALVQQNRTYVESRLNLLRGDPEILQAVAERRITLGVAAELNKMERKADRDYYLHWAGSTGATISMVRQWRQTVEARGPVPVAGDGNGTSPAPAPQVEQPPLVCAACEEFEPAQDVEFKYLHRGCRRRMDNALRKLGLDPSKPLVIQLEYLATSVEMRDRS